MSALVIVSFAAEPDRALAVLEAAATHPHVSRHVYDEQLRRVSVVLDLAHLHSYADRCRERERVDAWLLWCHAERCSMAWMHWCAWKGMVPA